MSPSLQLKAARLGAALVIALAALPGTASAETVTETFNAGLNPSFVQSVMHDPGSFTDYFTFSLSPAGNVAAQGVSLSFANFFNISDGNFRLYSGAPGSGVGLGATTALNNIQTNYNNLGAGSYFFDIKGTVDGALGGSYLFSMITTPVPEPGQMALLLSGLGLIGAMIRRRLPSAV